MLDVRTNAALKILLITAGILSISGLAAPDGVLEQYAQELKTAINAYHRPDVTTWQNSLLNGTSWYAGGLSVYSPLM